MSSKKLITAPIKDELKEFEPYFRKSTKTEIPLLDTIINYIIRRKGKQMRPILVFLAAKLNGTFNERTYHAALTIELLHTATLVHDDVVDESYQRRGFFSVNAIWKNKLAVLVGDFILAKGMLWSLEHKDYDLLQHISTAVRDMSEGEILQIEKARKLDITEDVYFEIIRKKTASLMAAASAVGTCSVSADEGKTEIMKQFGEYVGVAFQLKDDLFDFQKSSFIGKPAGNDIREKKLTLPLIYALNESENSEKRKFLKIIKKRDKSSADINAVIEFVNKKGGIAYAEQKMNLYREKATNIVDTYPDSEVKSALIEYIRYVIERKK